MILCSKLKNGVCKLVTKSQVVTKFDVTKSRLHCTLNLPWKLDNQYYHPPPLSWKIKTMTLFMNVFTERESCPGWHATFLLTVAAAFPSQA